MNDEQLEPAEEAENAESADYRLKKRWIVKVLLGYSVMLGIASCFLPEEDTPLDFVLGLPLLILGVSWCFMDAAERSHRIGPLMKLTLILLFIAGFPIYLFQTRGIVAFKTFTLALLLLGAMFTCMFVASLATIYLGSATGFWELAD